MRVLARRMIFLGSNQVVVMVNNSPCMICARRALRRLVCEGRRSGSSHGESVRSTSCPPLRPHAHSSTSVCIQRFKLYTARFVQMLRTCCCPEPHNDAQELQHTFQKRRFGVATVDNDPNSFPRFFQDGNEPLDQSRGQLKLGGKTMPSPAFGNRRHRLLANVVRDNPNDISSSPSLALPL